MAFDVKVSNVPRYCKEGEKQGIVSAFRPRLEKKKRKKALMASGGCLKTRKRGKSFHVVLVIDSTKRELSLPPRVSRKIHDST